MAVTYMAQTEQWWQRSGLIKWHRSQNLTAIGKIRWLALVRDQYDTIYLTSQSGWLVIHWLQVLKLISFQVTKQKTDHVRELWYVFFPCWINLKSTFWGMSVRGKVFISGYLIIKFCIMKQTILSIAWVILGKSFSLCLFQLSYLKTGFIIYLLSPEVGLYEVDKTPKAW